ncbi:homeotic protein female sterile-like [Cydia strobilella]|uniref:homeotic protein female sterile-like n=1 Tax=Cydia strobilella TaxID=1100964 RepID=UPI0030063FFA
MCDLCAPAKPEEKTFDDLVKLVREHLEPARSEIAERHIFRQRKQLHGESIREYLQNLKHLAKTCNFGSGLEVNLGDQFVSGLLSEEMRLRLFAVRAIDYKRAVELALALEAAEKHAAVGALAGAAAGRRAASRGGGAAAERGRVGVSVGAAGRRAASRGGGAAAERGRVGVSVGAAGRRAASRGGGAAAERGRVGVSVGAAGRRAASRGGGAAAERGPGGGGDGRAAGAVRRARCGKTGHAEGRCRYKHFSCDACGEKGHLKVMCRKEVSKKSSKVENIRKARRAGSFSSENSSECITKHI